MRAPRIPIVALLAAFALGGCSSGPIPGSSALPPPDGATTRLAKPSPALFVLSNDDGISSLNEYALGGKRAVRTIHGSGGSGIASFAVDGLGDLYAVECRGGNPCSILAYKPGSTTVADRIVKNVDAVTAIVAAPHGGVNVASQPTLPDIGGPGWVNLITPGSTKPAKVIGHIYPINLALDAAATMYVERSASYSSSTAYVSIYPAGASKPSLTISSGIDNPGAMTIDRSGNLFVANVGSSGTDYSVSVYPRGASQPGSTITAGLANPRALAVDANGNLYVANSGIAKNGRYTGANVAVYAPGATTPSRVIAAAKGLSPISIAFDPSGNLYVAYAGTRGSNVSAYRNGTRLWYHIPQQGQVASLLIGPS